MVDRYSNLLLLVLLSAFFAAQPLRADEELPDLDMALGEDDFLFEEIPSVYSTSQYEHKIPQAPSSANIFTNGDVKQYSYRTPGETLSKWG